MNQKNAIEMRNITKKFGQFIANDQINLEIKIGEIHALIGENGAGKSTLMNQLFGLLKPNSGAILIKDQVVNITSPNDANDYGLSMVHQHFQLVENHSVIENIVLQNKDQFTISQIDYKLAKSKLLAVAKQYKMEIDPNLLVKKASVAMQQRIEILKMLYQGAEILIFDEPTAMLTPEEIQGLLKLFLDFKKQGKTIIFITHKLDEVKQIADRGTVLRRGKVIKTFKVANTSVQQISAMMVGHNLPKIKNNYQVLKNSQSILKITNLEVKHHNNPKVLGLKNFSLELKTGEILAIAGVEGNGQIELVNALFGFSKIQHGKIEVLNSQNKSTPTFSKLKSNNVRQRYALKFSYVPEDRYKYAMLEQENLFVNAILQTFYYYPFQRYGFLIKKSRNQWTKKIIEQFDVRGSNDGYALIGKLSGGNQQKFIVGREITRDHKIIVLFQPTRGLDVGAITFIHQQIIAEKKRGNAVLLISYELDEVMSLADQILVINQGEIIQKAQAKGLKREVVGEWMGGLK